MIDAQYCFDRLKESYILTFATVDKEQNPQVRYISAVHWEQNEMYFYTARGKNFSSQLLENGKVQIICYTQNKEMIRLSAKAEKASDEEQAKIKDIIFEEQPYLINVYPGQTREIGIIFHIKDCTIEYFNLGVHPIHRLYFDIGKARHRSKGFYITDECIACGTCQACCPQGVIHAGDIYSIGQDHCLHCGNCFEHCPTDAIRNLDKE
ncbi:MAG: 4Fe-4S binding protein [Bacteroidales bacterium]|nr:4Fe-4S binding protein [Bacteroidales bacterium]